jgi:hypothetical protein
MADDRMSRRPGRKRKSAPARGNLRGTEIQSPA